MLTFFTILGFCSTVLIWYAVNINSGKGGEDGFLALMPDEFDGERATLDDSQDDMSKPNVRFNKQDDPASNPHAIHRVNLKADYAPGNNNGKKLRYRQKDSPSNTQRNTTNTTSAHVNLKQKKRATTSSPKPKFRVKEKPYHQTEQDDVE